MDLIWIFLILILLGLGLAGLNWRFLFFMLRSCNHPPVMNLRDDPEGRLYFEAVAKSTIIQGIPGSGKTMYAVAQVATFAMEHPDCTIVCLEMSGAFKREMIRYAMSMPGGDKLLERMIVDDLCRSDAVKPMPEFSEKYAVDPKNRAQWVEEQAQRVSANLKHLHPEIVAQNPTMAAAYGDPAREMSRLLMAMRDQENREFQITEGKRLLSDEQFNKAATFYYGGHAPTAKKFFEQEVWAKKMSFHDRHLLTLALRNALTDVDTQEARATLGLPDPAYTFRNAISEHKIVTISGEYLLHQRPVLGFLMVGRFSMLMTEINRRRANGKYSLVIIVIDELPWLLKATGLSEEIGDLHSFYRNRNVGVIVIIQNHSQLSEVLLEKTWNFGSIVTFANENEKEATNSAKNLLKYNPLYPKNPLPLPGREETYQGEMAQLANFIMNLKNRECLVKRYYTESQKDPYVRHVRKTREMPNWVSDEQLEEMVEKLALKDTVPVKDALDYLRKKKLGKGTLDTSEEAEATTEPGQSLRRKA